MVFSVDEWYIPVFLNVYRLIMLGFGCYCSCICICLCDVFFIIFYSFSCIRRFYPLSIIILQRNHWNFLLILWLVYLLFHAICYLVYICYCCFGLFSFPLICCFNGFRIALDVHGHCACYLWMLFYATVQVCLTSVIYYFFCAFSFVNNYACS